MDNTEHGRSPSGSGYSAEPGPISVVPAVPNAVRSKTATYTEMRPIPELSPEQMMRFDSKIIETNDCWHWIGTRNHGRPYFKLSGHAYFARRIMFAETYGRNYIDDALAICICGQIDCVNPDHIFLGDELELAAARKQYGGYPEWAGRRAGENNPNARFSDVETVAIFEAVGSLDEIAKRFGASRGHVWRVKNGRARASAIVSGRTAKTGLTRRARARPAKLETPRLESPMTDMDKMMIEKVALAIHKARFADQRVVPDMDPNDTEYAERLTRAAISAYNPDDRLREALERIAASMPGGTHKENSEARRDIARSALSPLSQGDG